MPTFSIDELARDVYRAISLVAVDREEVAALVSLDDLDLIRRLEDEADIRAVEEARAEGLDPVPFEEFCKELGLG